MPMQHTVYLCVCSTIYGTICSDHVSQRIIYKLVRLIAWCGMLFNLLFGHNWFIYQRGALNYIFCSFGANNADGCRCLCAFK